VALARDGGVVWFDRQDRGSGFIQAACVPDLDTDGSVGTSMNPTPESTEREGPEGGPLDGRVLILGARRRCRRLVRHLGHGPWAGLPVVGFVDAGHRSPSGPMARGRGRQLVVHPKAEPLPVLGCVDRLPELVDQSRATHLLVAVSDRPARRLRPQLARLFKDPMRIHWLTDDTKHRDVSRGHHPAWSSPRLRGQLRWGRMAKRLVDIVGSALGLLMLTPLFLGVAVAILVTSGRPIFYRQDRVGQGGRAFRMWKFRSMRQDAELMTGPIWACDHDERCTRVGDWLRHTNIDELPQLINVLLGDMSLVGPRPERPVFVEQFRLTEEHYDLRHAMPLGMTGWAQVHGWRGRTSLRKRVQYDLDYIQRWSFWLDFKTLFMTLQHVVWGKTSWTITKRRLEP
jgi:undecaprenyl-phosphate glucose phosphotransferase